MWAPRFPGPLLLGMLVVLQPAPPASAAMPPSLLDMAASWLDPNSPLSNHTDPPQLPPNNRDLPTINNFWGSVGICPENTRPVDMFAINSLELPPFAGCGSGDSNPYGCGFLAIDGKHVDATATRWLAHEAGRRSDLQAGSGVVVQSATRMAFEQNGVLWTINISNPAAAANAVTINVTFGLAATISRFSTVGTWVYQVHRSLRCHRGVVAAHMRACIRACVYISTYVRRPMRQGLLIHMSCHAL